MGEDELQSIMKELFRMLAILPILMVMVFSSKMNVFAQTHQPVPLKWFTFILCKFYPNKVNFKEQKQLQIFFEDSQCPKLHGQGCTWLLPFHSIIKLFAFRCNQPSQFSSWGAELLMKPGAKRWAQTAPQLLTLEKRHQQPSRGNPLKDVNSQETFCVESLPCLTFL